MAKKQKIKRYKKTGYGVYKASPHPLTIILAIVVVVGLVFVGMSLFRPFYEFIMDFGNVTGGESMLEALSEPEPPKPDISRPESKPEPEPVKIFEGVHAAFMPLATALDQTASASFLESLPSGVNSVMVDIKNSQGQLLYSTKNEKAVEWGAAAEDAFDLKALSEMAAGKNLRVIARMNAFSDPIAARGDRENNAIKYQNSEMLWLDNYADRGGKPWLNPYSPEVREYLVSIAVEAAENGAAMVVMDSMRFPDDMTGSATFGGAEKDMTRSQALKSFMTELEQALSPHGARAAAYIPVTAISQPQREARYGGSPLAVASNIALGVLPEQLETGYLSEGVNVTKPAIDPAAMVSEALDYVMRQPLGSEINIIPLLGAERSGGFAMTPEKISAQIEAVKNAGTSEYILYSISGEYPG